MRKIKMYKIDKDLTVLISLIAIVLSIFTRVKMPSSVFSDAIVFIVFAYHLLYKKKKIVLSTLKTKIILWYIFLIMISIICIGISIHKQTLFFYHYMVAVLYLLTFSIVIESASDLKLVGVIIVNLTVIVSIFSITQYIGTKLGVDLGSNFLYVRESVLRLSGLYGNPNYYAISLLISQGIVLGELGRKKSISNVVLYIVLGVALIMTFSRGAYISFATINILFIYLNFEYIKNSRYKKTLLTLSLILVGTVLVVILSNEYFLAKVMDMFNGNTNPRYITWRVGLTELKSSPLLNIFIGLGSDSFHHIPGNLLKMQPHNSFIKIIVENGIVGILMYFYFFSLVYKNTRVNGTLNPYFYSIVALIFMGLSNDVFHLKEFSLVVSLYFIQDMTPTKINIGGI